jgi:hypothetical protein
MKELLPTVEFVALMLLAGGPSIVLLCLSGPEAVRIPRWLAVLALAVSIFGFQGLRFNHPAQVNNLYYAGEVKGK